MEKQELNFDNAMNDFEDQQAQSINQQISLGAANVSGKVKARTKRMLERGAMQESLDKFAGINEEEILTFKYFIRTIGTRDWIKIEYGQRRRGNTHTAGFAVIGADADLQFGSVTG